MNEQDEIPLKDLVMIAGLIILLIAATLIDSVIDRCKSIFKK